MTTILKLGGSVVTHKEEPDTVDEETLDAVSAAVGAHYGASAAASDDIVVVHGGGSFGHHHAAKHGITRTSGTHDAEAVAEVHDAMTELNRAVVGTLHDHDVDALPIRPLSLAHRTTNGDLSLPSATIEAILSDGFTPVLHGDVIVKRNSGGTILSGDEIVVHLARSLSADRVGLCSTVPGVLDEDGCVVDTVESFDDVAAILGESDATDVTGGMAGKVEAALDLDVPAHVFDPGGLSDFLAGGSPGTRITGDR